MAIWSKKITPFHYIKFRPTDCNETYTETSIYFSNTTKNGHGTTRKKPNDNKRYRNDSSLHMVDHIIFNEVSNNENMIYCFCCMIRNVVLYREYKVFCTWFLRYHLAFFPLWDSLHVKEISSHVPCLMLRSEGSSIHSNFS